MRTVGNFNNIIKKFLDDIHSITYHRQINECPEVKIQGSSFFLLLILREAIDVWK